MIENEQQYETTKYQLAKLESAFARSDAAAQKLDSRLRKAIIAGIESQIEDLRQELTEYERKVRIKKAVAG
jgi:hypothetical protein